MATATTSSTPLLGSKTTNPASAPPSSSNPSTPHRLGMPFDTRLLLTTTLSFLSGFTLGTLSTSRLAALRFRAENAHRLPLSQPGWYLYHKSKSYYKYRYGVLDGLRKGGYVAAWSAVFFVVEESLDVFRGTWVAGRTVAEMEGVDELDIRRVERGVGVSRDFWSSAMAGMVTGGVWSVWHHFPISTAARTIRLGLGVGLGYGVAQDALAWARGRYKGEEGESWVYKGARNRRGGEEGD